MEFEADILLLFHTTKIARKFQCTVHIGNVVQTAVIKSLNKVRVLFRGVHICVLGSFGGVYNGVGISGLGDWGDGGGGRFPLIDCAPN